MNDRYLPVIVLVLGVLLGSLITFITQSPQNGVIDQEENRLHVTGSGEVKMDPDQVEISLGVEVTEDTAEEAREENANKTSKVIEALKDIGISEDQIETERYSLFEERERVEEEVEIVGYRAVNTIKITSNETDMATQIIDTAIINGANDVDNVIFTLQDSTREEARKEAFRKAVTNAKSEADNIASEMGLILGSPVNVDITSTGFRPFQPQYRFEAAAETPTPMPTQTPSSTPIQPGKVEVTASVNVVYMYS